MDNKEVHELLKLLNINPADYQPSYRAEEEDIHNLHPDRLSKIEQLGKYSYTINSLMNMTLQCLGAIRLLIIEQEQYRTSCFYTNIDYEDHNKFNGVASSIQRQLFHSAVSAFLSHIIVGKELHAHNPTKDLVESYPWSAYYSKSSWIMLPWALLQPHLLQLSPDDLGDGERKDRYFEYLNSKLMEESKYHEHEVQLIQQEDQQQRLRQESSFLPENSVANSLADSKRDGNNVSAQQSKTLPPISRLPSGDSENKLPKISSAMSASQQSRPGLLQSSSKLTSSIASSQDNPSNKPEEKSLMSNSIISGIKPNNSNRTNPISNSNGPETTLPHSHPNLSQSMEELPPETTNNGPEEGINTQSSALHQTSSAYYDERIPQEPIEAVEDYYYLVKHTLKYFPESITEIDRKGQHYLYYLFANYQHPKHIKYLLQNLIMKYHPSSLFLLDKTGQFSVHYLVQSCQSTELLLILSQYMKLPLKTLLTMDKYTQSAALLQQSTNSMEEINRSIINFSCKDYYGNYPLHKACLGHCSLEVFKEILFNSSKECVQTVNNNEQLPLHCLCMNPIDSLIHSSYFLNQFLEKMQLLISFYPNAIKQTDKKAWLPIHYAVYYQTSLDIIQYLHQLYPQGLIRPLKSNRNVLHYAIIQCKSYPVIKFLLEQSDTLLKGLDNYQRLPIHNLLARNINQMNYTKIKIFQLLIQMYPGCLYIHDIDGLSLLDLARRDNHGDLILRMILRIDPSLDPQLLGELSYVATKTKYHLNAWQKEKEQKKRLKERQEREEKRRKQKVHSRSRVSDRHSRTVYSSDEEDEEEYADGRTYDDVKEDRYEDDSRYKEDGEEESFGTYEDNISYDASTRRPPRGKQRKSSASSRRGYYSKSQTSRSYRSDDDSRSYASQSNSYISQYDDDSATRTSYSGTYDSRSLYTPSAPLSYEEDSDDFYYEDSDEADDISQVIHAKRESFIRKKHEQLSIASGEDDSKSKSQKRYKKIPRSASARLGSARHSRGSKQPTNKNEANSHSYSDKSRPLTTVDGTNDDFDDSYSRSTNQSQSQSIASKANNSYSDRQLSIPQSERSQSQSQYSQSQGQNPSQSRSQPQSQSQSRSQSISQASIPQKDDNSSLKQDTPPPVYS